MLDFIRGIFTLSGGLVAVCVVVAIALAGIVICRRDSQGALKNGYAAAIRNAYPFKALLPDYLYRSQSLPAGQADDRDGGTITRVSCFSYRANPDRRGCGRLRSRGTARGLDPSSIQRLINEPPAATLAEARLPTRQLRIKARAAPNSSSRKGLQTNGAAHNSGGISDDWQ
jgi:hypothetical protein